MARPCRPRRIATPSSRRRVNGVEVDATIQRERAVKFDFHTGQRAEILDDNMGRHQVLARPRDDVARRYPGYGPEEGQRKVAGIY